jgi:hypothetical protein
VPRGDDSGDGLTIRASLDTGAYPAGLKVTDAQLAAVRLETVLPHRTHQIKLSLDNAYGDAAPNERPPFATVIDRHERHGKRADTRLPD